MERVRSSASSEDALDRRADQPAGLELVQPAQLARLRRSTSARDVDVLPADHAVDARRAPPARPTRREHARAARRAARRARGRNASAYSASPGEDRDVLAVSGRGRSGGRAAARRRPSPAGRRGSASRCGSARARRRAGARPRSASRPRVAVASASTGRMRLPPREQRVAHRLLQPVGRRLAGEPQPLEVGLDLRRAGAPGSPPSADHGARAGLAGAGAASAARTLALELGARLGGDARALLDERGGTRPRRARRSAACARGVLEALDQAAPSCSAAAIGRDRAGMGTAVMSRAPVARRTAARIPFTKPGASAPQNALAVSTASSIAPSGGIGRSAADQRRGAASRAARRAGWRARAARSARPTSSCAWRSISTSSSSACVGRGVRERARERAGVAARTCRPADGL